MRISDWSSDVCSSDLFFQKHPELVGNGRRFFLKHGPYSILLARFLGPLRAVTPSLAAASGMRFWLFARSEEHTSELQSLMRISYAVFCLKKKKTNCNSAM